MACQFFFSTDVPIESSPCEDLGKFISLNCSAKQWANLIVSTIYEYKREDHSILIKSYGFDSKTEAIKLLKYHEVFLK